MLKNKLLFLALAILIVSVMSIIGCSNKKSDDVVRIGEVTRSLFYAPQYVAIEKGFFKDEGIQVELTTTPGGDKTMTALLSDAIDVALVGSETSIYVAQQGSTDPVINFAQLTQTDGTFLVSRAANDSFTWEDVKGSVYLGQRQGGMPQMAGEFTLRKNGIDPVNDLELIQNIDFANIAPAFSSGTGEFVQLFEPTASIFEKEGIGQVVASFGIESGRLPYTVFMTKQSYIDDKSGVVERFTRAIYKAQQWVNEHTAEEIAVVVAPYFDNVDSEIMASSIDRYKQQQSFAIDPIVDEEEWENLLNIIEQSGELKSRIPHSQIVNTTFAELVIEK